MDVKFIVLEGKGLDTHEFPLRDVDFVIGRSAACDLQIDHSRVSLEHCKISRRDDGRIVLEDLHSTYGTFLNDRDVELSALHDGDVIRVGPVVLLCAFGSEASTSRRRVLEQYRSRVPTTSVSESVNRLRDPNDDSPIVHSARQIFDRITGQAEETFEDRPAPATARGQTVVRSKRVEVEESEGVALVNLLDRTIIHDMEIQHVATALEKLIENGQRRIVVDFGNVRHMSSQAVGVLIQAQRRLKNLGGMLKVCNPNPEVAEVFKITNLTRAIEIHVDEHAANLAGWPDTAADSAASNAVASAQATLPADPRIRPVAQGPGGATAPPEVQLVIEVGKSKGKVLRIKGPKYLIGRDPSCQLRPASEAVSREHTRIEIRDNKVFVRDLGTTNGTLLRDALLRGEEAEAREGDRLQIGPLVFRFAIKTEGESAASKPDVEDAAASWLLDGGPVSLADTAMLPVPAAEAAMKARQRALDEIQRVKTSVQGNSTIVTILSKVLKDEEQIAPVRHELIELMDKPVPKQLIVRMGNVQEVSSLAIAMLLGHFQRLDRLGGGMRICELEGGIEAPFEEALMTSPIQIFHTVDEALREPWPIT